MYSVHCRYLGSTISSFSVGIPILGSVASKGTGTLLPYYITLNQSTCVIFPQSEFTVECVTVITTLNLVTILVSDYFDN